MYDDNTSPLLSCGQLGVLDMNIQPLVQNNDDGIAHKFLIFGGIDDYKQEMKATSFVTVSNHNFEKF